MVSIEWSGEGTGCRSHALLAETESTLSSLSARRTRILNELMGANPTRRLKCNRTQPCENCVKRGDAMSCSYAAPGSRKKTSVASPSSNNPGDMQNRIDRLEGLVLSLMTNGAQSAGPAAADRTLSMSASTGSMEYPQDVEVDDLNNHNGMMRPDGEEAESETDQVAQSLGVLKVMDNNKSMYFGEAHWAAILTDVSNLRKGSVILVEALLIRSPDYRSQELFQRAQKATGGASSEDTSTEEGRQFPGRVTCPVRRSESARICRAARLIAQEAHH